MNLPLEDFQTIVLDLLVDTETFQIVSLSGASGYRMYMRLIHMNVELNSMPGLREFYGTTVVPQLHAVKGCLFAGLIQSHDHPNECISMTLWGNQNHAFEYGRSALYRNLMDNVKHFLADSTEWKIQLSQDLILEAVPVSQEPVLKSYSIETYNNKPSGPEERSQFYVRIVAPKVHPGKMNDFKTIYSNEVLPALRDVKGCRYAFLTECGNGNNEVLSITIWDSEQAASEYESSGLFDHLTEKLSGALSDLFQWKMDLEKDSGSTVITSEDIMVHHYQAVAGESFRGL